MLKTTFRIIFEFIFFASSPKLLPKYKDPTPTLLEGDPYPPRGQPIPSQVTQRYPLGE